MIIGLTEDFFHQQGMGGQVIILRLHHLYDFRHETNGNKQNHHVPSCYDVHVMPCPIFSSTALNINKPFPYALTRTDIIINIIININKALQHDTTRQGLLAPNSSESWPKTNKPCFSSYVKFMPNSFHRLLLSLQLFLIFHHIFLIHFLLTPPSSPSSNYPCC